MIEIRNMKIEDFDQIQDQIQNEFDEFWTASILKSELENESSKYIVAIENNKVIGFAGISFSIYEAEITNIVVKKSDRKKGIGKLLLERLIEISKELSISKISLEVNENNIIAINLYKSFDFTQVGLRKKYYNGIENAIIMTKNI